MTAITTLRSGSEGEPLVVHNREGWIIMGRTVHFVGENCIKLAGERQDRNSRGQRSQFIQLFTQLPKFPTERAEG